MLVFCQLHDTPYLIEGPRFALLHAYITGVDIDISCGMLGSRLRQTGTDDVGYDMAGSRVGSPGEFGLEYDELGVPPSRLTSAAMSESIAETLITIHLALRGLDTDR